MFKTIYRRGRLWTLAALVALGTVAPTWAETVIPVHYKNAALRLPVNIDDNARTELREIKLYVRGPNGKWSVAETAPATQKSFDFKAPEDGEYWFTFAIVDKRGRQEPANVEAVVPHRAVMVDTTPPEVGAQPTNVRGMRVLQCHVKDISPDWATLRVVYADKDGVWQPLSVHASDTPTIFSIPDPAILDGKIRITVADRAGNRTSRELDLGDPTARLGFNNKAATDKGRPDPTLFPGDTDTPKAPRGVLPVEHRDPVRPMLPDVPKLPDLPADNIRTPMLPPVPMVPMGDPGLPIKTPNIPTIPDPILEPPMKLPPIDNSTVRKPNDLVSVPPIPPTVAPPKPTVEKTPAPSAAHKVLDTNIITIDYKLEGVVRVSNKIDFWATGDSGRTWFRLRDEANGVPPAKLALPGDGKYGIRIRPGAGAKPPEPGEDPDCEIEIDTTKPVVKMKPPILGSGDDFGTVVLQWMATDTNLLSNSIKIFYASRPEGPWKVIVEGYKNEGSYNWAVPTDLVGPIYLRIQAMDTAGNIGQHDLATPIEMENGKQRVKVIGITGGK